MAADVVRTCIVLAVSGLGCGVVHQVCVLDIRGACGSVPVAMFQILRVGVFGALFFHLACSGQFWDICKVEPSSLAF